MENKFKKKWSNKINVIAAQIVEWRKTKGFKTPESLDTEEERDAMLGKLMLVVTEVSEAAEAVRHNDLHNFSEEIADAIIRLLDIGSTMKIDLEMHLAEKMDINSGREIRHGKNTSL